MLKEKDFKKMAELLRKGSTMLNKACPVCNSPLFKFKSEDVFCPICNKKVIIVKEGKEIIKKYNDMSVENLKYTKESVLSNYSEVTEKLEKILIKKFNWLLNKLEDEDQIKNLESYSITLLNILNLIEKLRKNEF